MLKTNSRKAIENIRNYIMNDVEYISERSGYTIDTENTDEVLAYAWSIFKDEKKYEIEQNYHCANYAIFQDWASGLALGNLFCYWYNRPAVDDLGDILEETDEERSKYTESEAERVLTTLIYREMEKAARRVYLAKVKSI